jgi:tellurite resistance-related uncharacterized protein
MSLPTTLINSAILSQSSAISFLDLPREIRNKIYHDVCRGRTNWPINLGLLSPTWTAPQPPAALMNTCRSIAAELMPIYFKSCFFILDTTQHDKLRQELLKWLKEVGSTSSAHFHRLRVIHGTIHSNTYEIEVTVTEKKEVVIKELKKTQNGDEEWTCIEKMSRDEPFSQQRYHCLRIGKEMVKDLETRLTYCINNNGTGGLGVAEFDLILERIDHHMEWFVKYDYRRRNKRTAARKVRSYESAWE